MPEVVKSIKVKCDYKPSYKWLIYSFLGFRYLLPENFYAKLAIIRLADFWYIYEII